MLSYVALFATGLLMAAEGAVLMYDPAMLFSLYGRPTLNFNSTEGAVLMSLSCYFGAACLTFGFLFLHLLPHAEKHSAGCRTATMLFALCVGVAGFRYYEAQKAGDAETTAVSLKSAAVLGGAFALSVLGTMTAPKTEKKAKKSKKTR